VELRREAALREAAAADEAIARGERTGLLHGVPMTVKEALNVAGRHTIWGEPSFRGSSPTAGSSRSPASSLPVRPRRRPR
jgi:Asp-tRNA(Asn)/Glu-tRNA(Gln) amidotransferase A subunit family amidase